MNPGFAAALAAAFWGTTYVVTDYLPANPFFIAAVRALGGGLLLLACARMLPNRVWLVRAVVAGTFNCGLFFALLFVGALRLPGGVAGTLQALVPLFTILIAWPLLAQAPSLFRIVAVLVGVAGTALLLMRGAAAPDAIGVAAALGSALSSAVGAVLIQRWRRPPSMVAFTAWQLLAAGFELTLFALLAGDMPAAITAVNVAAFAYLIVAGTALAFALWFMAISRAGAARMAPFVLFSPVVAFVMDALVRGIVPTPLQLAGAVLVMASILMSQRRDAPDDAPTDGRSA